MKIKVQEYGHRPTLAQSLGFYSATVAFVGGSIGLFVELIRGDPFFTIGAQSHPISLSEWIVFQLSMIAMQAFGTRIYLGMRNSGLRIDPDHLQLLNWRRQVTFSCPIADVLRVEAGKYGGNSTVLTRSSSIEIIPTWANFSELESVLAEIALLNRQQNASSPEQGSKDLSESPNPRSQQTG